MNNLRLEFDGKVTEYELIDGSISNGAFFFEEVNVDWPDYEIAIYFDINDRLALELSYSSMSPNAEKDCYDFSGNRDCLTVTKIALNNIDATPIRAYTKDEFKKKMSLTDEKYKEFVDAIKSAFDVWWNENADDRDGVGWYTYLDDMWNNHD